MILSEVGHLSIILMERRTHSHMFSCCTFTCASILARIYLLSEYAGRRAYPYGTPTVLSSFTFQNYDAGSPSNGTGACSGSGGANGWQCQHRWTVIAGMVKWRNGVSGALNNWVTGTSQQVAFGRGKLKSSQGKE